MPTKAKITILVHNKNWNIARLGYQFSSLIISQKLFLISSSPCLYLIILYAENNMPITMQAEIPNAVPKRHFAGIRLLSKGVVTNMDTYPR